VKKPISLFDLETLPFWEYRRPEQEKNGALFQMYNKPVRVQVKTARESFKEEEKIFYLQISIDKSDPEMPEVEVKLRHFQWKRDKINLNELVDIGDLLIPKEK